MNNYVLTHQHCESCLRLTVHDTHSTYLFSEVLVHGSLPTAEMVGGRHLKHKNTRGNTLTSPVVHLGHQSSCKAVDPT